MKHTIKTQFARYVSQNILGMIGLSCYILADTFFISQAVGTNGITALNLVLPLYSLIFAIGSMIGTGSAIRFSIAKNQHRANGDIYFSNAVFFGALIGLVFTAAGLLFPAQILSRFGADARIILVGTDYTRIFMLFAPCFIWNYICNAFVRNDGNPGIAMAATLFSSLFNIVFDYVLMFPCHMGMSGAALATALSPLIGIALCCIHFRGSKNTVSFQLTRPSIRRLLSSCQVGIAAFVGEISSGVITMVFNLLILSLAGNIGVAAYGIVANTALVATAVFNGVAQGSQPLISTCFGKGDLKHTKMLRRLSIWTALVLGLIILAFVTLAADPITAIFNKEQNPQLTDYAVRGLRLYFIGFLPAGINIVISSYFAATTAAKWSFATSISRGFVVIVVCAVVLAHFFGMTGVWTAFPIAELITSFIAFIGIRTVDRSSIIE